jgi:hypothetical protein
MALIAAAVAWIAVLVRAPGTWRRSGSPARRALWLALLFLALGWILRVPAGYRALDEFTHVGNLAQVVGDGLALATACAILAMLIFQTSSGSDKASRRVLVRIGVLGVVLVAMGVSFDVAPLNRETFEFVTTYRTTPGFLAYELPYLAFLSYAFYDLTRLCRRYAQLSDRRYLKAGMRLIQAAGVLGIVYVMLRIAYLVAVQVAPTVDLSAYEPVSKLIVAVLSILAIVGAVLPAAGPRVENYRAHRELYPLWSAMHKAEPAIALDAPQSAGRDRLRVRDLGYRLHRRVIEIRDGQLALRPYRRTDVALAARRHGQQRQLSGEDLEATVEAATLSAAVKDKAAGRGAPPGSSARTSSGGTRLSEEISWLRKVSRSFRTAGDNEESRRD